MAYKLKDRKEKMLYKGSVYELTLQWDRESLRKCFCGMPPFYAHIRKDGANFAQIDCYSNGDDFSVVPMHPLFILKSKDLHAVSYFVNRPLELDRCWQSYKVATRHHYRPSDMGLWADTIRLLEQCGKDICNPKYICPQNLRAEHDYWMNRHNQMEQKRRSQEQMQRAKRKEAEFYKEKSRYFGITITDKDLVISVLDSLEAFQAEGNALHHCVFQCEYYAKADSLILSAHDKEGNRIETIEFSLTEGKVIQSRGLCNTNTPHHDRIVRLVNSHAHQILAAKQTA